MKSPSHASSAGCHRCSRWVRPTLSDEAAVQIHGFLERMISLFESCYFDQIHRFYQQRDEDAMNQHDDRLSCDWEWGWDGDDPPF